MGSSKADVEVSYDVSNEFFRLWLDERMNYTCAVYETPDQPLEAAQLNKLEILSEFAKVTPEKRVLDVGCGWGACLEYLATARKVKQAVGVTLSTEQAKEVNDRKIPGVTVIGADTVDARDLAGVDLFGLLGREGDPNGVFHVS